jgi:hypothetical protein
MSEAVQIKEDLQELGDHAKHGRLAQRRFGPDRRALHEVAHQIQAESLARPCRERLAYCRDCRVPELLQDLCFPAEEGLGLERAEPPDKDLLDGHDAPQGVARSVDRGVVAPAQDLKELVAAVKQRRLPAPCAGRDRGGLNAAARTQAGIRHG